MTPENIPSDDELFRRTLPYLYNKRTRQFAPGAYTLRRDMGETYLSVDWEKFSTPEKSSISNKKKYCVAGLYARVPRGEGLQVNHSPSKRNKAHSAIAGEKLLDLETEYDVSLKLAEKSRPRVICDDANRKC